MKKAVLFTIAVALLGAAAFFMMKPNEAAPAPTATPAVMETTTLPAEAQVEAELPPAAEAVAVHEFTVVGDNFSYDTSEIRVKKGETVKIIFKNAEGFHDWVIDEFAARTPLVKAGEEATVEFVADKVGKFEYYCSVGQHRTMGMKGMLIVEE